MNKNHKYSGYVTDIKRKLYLGFGILLVLVLAIAAAGLLRMHVMDTDLRQLVDRTNHKSAQIDALRNAVQQRRYSLFMIAVLDDEFAVSDEWERYNASASAYLVARDRLLQSNLDQREKQALTELDQLTLIGQPMQNKVLSLLESGNRSVARDFLLETARPAQQDVMDHIDGFHAMEARLADLAAGKIQADNTRYFNIILGLGIVVLLVGMATAIAISRRTIRQAAQVEYQHRRFKSLFDASMDAVLLWDETRLLDCNPAAERIFGLPQDAACELHLTNLVQHHQEDGRSGYELLEQHLHQASLGGEARFECELTRLPNTPFPAEVLINQVVLDNIPVHQIVVRDISQRRQAEQQIQHMAYHDRLTGLANGLLLRDRLEHAIPQAKRSGSVIAVININLRQFKNINESLGHDAGDEVLLQTSKRLNALTREGDTVARIGADEFTICCQSVKTEDAVLEFANEIQACLEAPYSVDGHEAYCGSSIGIALYPRDGVSAVELQRNAESAMHRVRDEGKQGYRLFAESMNSYAFRRMKLEGGIQAGIEEEQFEVYYQPKHTIDAKQVFVGMEALVRWNHPELGILRPTEFIPIAESSKLIEPLGEWILYTACRDAASLLAHGLEDISIAVNLSPRQFHDPHIVETVERILAETGLPPACLELEVTESVTMTNKEESLDLIRRLKSRGIRIAIDDFGTGYSSLSYLHELPVDTLKIDQSFIMDVNSNSSHAELTALIITLAHKLGLSVVAEGVETEDHLKYLQGQACDLVQGYYLGMPMPLAEFRAFVSKRTGIALLDENSNGISA